MNTQSKESQLELTPATSLELLKAGNERFVSGANADRNLLEQVKTTTNGQFPFAVVLSCIDSRVPAEVVFDQGIGDIFSARVAGNVVNDDILGSMEFACKLAGSKLIVVLGHSSCGAVGGACKGVKLGNLSGLLEKIQPSVDLVNTTTPLNQSDFIQQVAEANVARVVQEIRAKSPVLKELFAQGDVGIVGAMYSVETGKVTFQSPTDA